MSFDFSDLDRGVRRAVQKFEKDARLALPKAKGVLDGLADTAKSILSSCVEAEYEPREERSAPEYGIREAQTQEVGRRSALLNMRAEVNMRWMEYLTGMMNNVLLGALADMLQALDNHDADQFTQAEQLACAMTRKCIEKRSALDQELTDRFGPQALSFEGAEPIDYPYEPLYVFIKRLMRVQRGQETADFIKENRGELGRLIEEIDPVWKDALLKRYPEYAKLMERD